MDYKTYRKIMSKIKLGVCKSCDMHGENNQCYNDKDNNAEECIYANQVAESVYDELYDE